MSRRSLAALFIAFALLLAACGDDGGSSSQDTASQETDGGDDSQDAAGDGGDVPQSDLEGYFTGDCAEAVQAFSAALASAGAAFIPGGDATAEDTADQLDAMAEAAPAEVSDDFAVLADVYAQFAQALADAGLDFNDPSSFQDPDAIAALESLDEVFDSDELEQASENIEAWFAANCEAP
jgi:hypothetical protein